MSSSMKYIDLRNFGSGTYGFRSFLPFKRAGLFPCSILSDLAKECWKQANNLPTDHCEGGGCVEAVMLCDEASMYCDDTAIFILRLQCSVMLS